MGLVIETDLGCDPDDLFALLYLVGAGVNLRAITVTPGDPDQIAVGKLLAGELGLQIPVCASHPKRDKLSATAFHTQLLEHFGYPTRAPSDGHGPDVIADMFNRVPDCQLFVCGPPWAIGECLKRQPDLFISRAVIQGGFIGYDVHGLPCRRLAKFESKTTMPTWNLNGAPGGAQRLKDATVGDRRWVGKNVCHTVVYDDAAHERVMAVPPRNRAAEVFREAMTVYRSRKSRPGAKKFHDPVAAVGLLHPEVITWVRAKPYKRSGEWGADLDDAGDLVAVDIDYDRFWMHIAEGT